MKKKIFILTGEESGDMRASELVNELNSKKFEIHGVGGDHLSQMGVKIVYSIDKISAFGIFEILKKIPSIFKFRSFLKKYVVKFQPDLVILVDYPGFNIPFLKWLKKRGFNTVYYVLPKVWAHGSSRIKPLKKYSDIMLSIIPFEEEIFGKNCFYIGNPVLNRVKGIQNKPNEKKYIGIFPGSRAQEIKYILPIMMETAMLFPKEAFILNVPQNILSETKKIVEKYPLDIKITENKYYDALLQSKFAIITSGTATLEAALLKIPFVILYKLNWFTFIILKMIAKVKYVGLPNIFLGKMAFKEFIQRDAKPEIIEKYIKKELDDPELNSRINKYGHELNKILGRSNIKMGIHKILGLMEDKNV